MERYLMKHSTIYAPVDSLHEHAFIITLHQIHGSRLDFSQYLMWELMRMGKVRGPASTLMEC